MLSPGLSIIFGAGFILSLTIWLFQIFFLSVFLNIMSSKLESECTTNGFLDKLSLYLQMDAKVFDPE